MKGLSQEHGSVGIAWAPLPFRIPVQREAETLVQASPFGGSSVALSYHRNRQISWNAC